VLKLILKLYALRNALNTACTRFKIG